MQQMGACLLDSPSHLRMLVKTQVVAGMFSPMAKVSVANRHCSPHTHIRAIRMVNTDNHDGKIGHSIKSNDNNSLVATKGYAVSSSQESCTHVTLC